MLDMGFEDQMKVCLTHCSGYRLSFVFVQAVMSLVPSTRQTLLFSATWPKSVQKLANSYLKTGFVHINIGETDELAANKMVSQQFFKLDDTEKERQLWKIWEQLVPEDKVSAATHPVTVAWLTTRCHN